MAKECKEKSTKYEVQRGERKHVEYSNQSLFTKQYTSSFC